MKKTLLFAGVFALALSAQSQTVVIDENFDSYASGDFLAASSELFVTWSGSGAGTTEDAVITDEVSVSGSNSALVEATSANGGPVDIMLPLAYDDGAYEVAFDINIAAGFGGYFNIQQTENPGDDWVIDVFFGSGTMNIVGDPGTGNVDVGSTAYTEDTWHNVKLAVYHAANLVEVRFDDALVGSHAAGDAPSNLGGINFFAFGAQGTIGKYYIDNLVVTDITELGIAEDAEASLKLSLTPNPTEDLLTVDLGAKSTIAQLEVVSMTGALVKATVLNGQQKHTFDVSSLESGFYFVRLQQDDLVLTKRLVIK